MKQHKVHNPKSANSLENLWTTLELQLFIK